MLVKTMKILGYIIHCLFGLAGVMSSTPSKDVSFIDILVGCLIICILFVWWFSSVGSARYLSSNKYTSNKILTAILAIIAIIVKIVLLVGSLVGNIIFLIILLLFCVVENHIGAILLDECIYQKDKNKHVSVEKFKFVFIKKHEGNTISKISLVFVVLNIILFALCLLSSILIMCVFSDFIFECLSFYLILFIVFHLIEFVIEFVLNSRIINNADKNEQYNE